MGDTDGVGDAVNDTLGVTDVVGVGDGGTHDGLPWVATWPPVQLLHTDAPALLYWLTPHMTAEVFIAPPGHAYPAGQSVAMEELVAQVYPAGPTTTMRGR